MDSRDSKAQLNQRKPASRMAGRQYCGRGWSLKREAASTVGGASSKRAEFVASWMLDLTSLILSSLLCIHLLFFSSSFHGLNGTWGFTKFIQQSVNSEMEKRVASEALGFQRLSSIVLLPSPPRVLLSP